jgi:exodeoxyribonuclease VII small subunit
LTRPTRIVDASRPARNPTGRHTPTPAIVTAEPPQSFEAALAELEALVAAMESGQLPLKESLAAYQRGAELLAYCQDALKDAQLQVEILEKGVLKAFRPEGADEA